jgi:hypothetical protein
MLSTWWHLPPKWITFAKMADMTNIHPVVHSTLQDWNRPIVKVSVTPYNVWQCVYITFVWWLHNQLLCMWAACVVFSAGLYFRIDWHQLASNEIYRSRVCNCQGPAVFMCATSSLRLLCNNVCVMFIVTIMSQCVQRVHCDY